MIRILGLCMSVFVIFSPRLCNWLVEIDYRPAVLASICRARGLDEPSPSTQQSDFLSIIHLQSYSEYVEYERVVFIP